MTLSNRSEKILVVYPGGLGDVILLAPALKQLRASLGPATQIDLLLENRAGQGAREFLGLTDWVNKIETHDFKGRFALLGVPKLLGKMRSYQAIVSSGSSPLVSVLLFLSGAERRIGFKSALKGLLTDPVVLNKEQYAGRMLLELVSPLTAKPAAELDSKPAIDVSGLVQPVPELEDKPYILVHPGVSKLGLQKRIIKSPQAAYWVDLVRKLSQDYSGYTTVLIGGPDDREVIAEISSNLPAKKNFLNLAERAFRIPELAVLIKRSAAFVCVDSAPLHLGVAVGANVVTPFGPTDPKKLVPELLNIKVVQVPGLLCQPCLWNRRTKACALPVCVDLQTPEQVLEALKVFCK